jgi:hypothetical protein
MKPIEIFSYLPQSHATASPNTIQISYDDLRTALLRHHEIRLVRVTMNEPGIVKRCEEPGR